jgi:hypothetical protein
MLRHSQYATLFFRKKLQNVTDLIRRRFELVFILYRILGVNFRMPGASIFVPLPHIDVDEMATHESAAEKI